VNDAPNALVRRLPLVGGEAANEPAARAVFERWQPGDRALDYCLLPYDPVAPVEGKLRSVAVLAETFALMGVEDEGLALVAQMRARLGHGRTVWGVKYDRARETLSWEFYFYDVGRRFGDLSPEGMTALFAPAVAVEPVAPRELPWHMLSVEFTPAHLRGAATTTVRAYLEKVSLSYELRGATLTLENRYSFHDPRAEIDAILFDLRHSVHWDRASVSLAALIPPELLRCRHICVANKRLADGMYFSRITVDQLLWFLKRFEVSPRVRAFVEARRASLDHLLWDVGFDFRSENGALQVTKSGFYGSF
jgi:hypothetical protein